MEVVEQECLDKKLF